MKPKHPGTIGSPLTVREGERHDTFGCIDKVFWVFDANGRLVCECDYIIDANVIANVMTKALDAANRRQRGIWCRYVEPFLAWCKYR